jgi:hypothetical protein
VTEKAQERLRVAIIVGFGLPAAYAFCVIIATVVYLCIDLYRPLPELPPEGFLLAGGTVMLMIAIAHRLKTGNWL